jgi:hypothetical protein
MRGFRASAAVSVSPAPAGPASAPQAALSRRLANPVVSLPGERKRVVELPAPGRGKEQPHVEPAELLLCMETSVAAMVTRSVGTRARGVAVDG